MCLVLFIFADCMLANKVDCENKILIVYKYDLNLVSGNRRKRIKNINKYHLKAKVYVIVFK